MDALLQHFETHINQLDAHWILIHSRDAKWIELINQVYSEKVSAQAAVEASYSNDEITAILNNHSVFHINTIVMQKKCLQLVINDSKVNQNLFLNKKQLLQNHHFIMEDLISIIVGYQCVREMLSIQVCICNVYICGI